MLRMRAKSLSIQLGTRGSWFGERPASLAASGAGSPALVKHALFYGADQVSGSSGDGDQGRQLGGS